MALIDLIGWLAAALFAASYFLKNPKNLRIIQAIAAIFWIWYGLKLNSAQVVITNATVVIMALYTMHKFKGVK